MNELSPVRRPALRWHGGKWLLAPWVIAQFPPHRIYVEPFGGGGSVLIRKPRSYAEVYNDLDQDVVNFFQVLRSPRAFELQDAVRLTPFARQEFEAAYEPTDDEVERARRLIIRSFMGFGSDGCNDARSTGFRANSNRSGTTPAHDWVNYAKAMPDLIDRLTGVIIENRDAIGVMSQHDGPDTLHYVDPPYLWLTRSKGSAAKSYKYEMTDNQHKDLLAYLKTVKGSVVLSGYPSQMYEDMLGSWKRITKEALADGARARTEVLWMNARALRWAGPLAEAMT